jgi:hypothetical protein
MIDLRSDTLPAAFASHVDSVRTCFTKGLVVLREAEPRVLAPPAAGCTARDIGFSVTR